MHVNTVFIKFWLQNKMKQKIKTTQFVTQTILQTIIMYYCSRYLGGVDDNFAFTEVNLLFCVSVANGLHLCCPFFMFCACVSIILRTHKSTFRLMQPWTPITMSASHKTLSLNVIWRWIHFNLRAL